MLTDELLLAKAKKLIENKLGWGDSADWSNQDFISLSKKMQEEINVSVSHVTLKRIWGKVKYESLPNTYTLSTLVQFIGYENWRDFKVKNGNGAIVSAATAKPVEISDQNKLPVKKPFHLFTIYSALPSRLLSGNWVVSNVSFTWNCR